MGPHLVSPARPAGLIPLSENTDRPTPPRAPVQRPSARSFVEVLAAGAGRPLGTAAPSASRVLRNLTARALGAEKRVDALIAAVAGGKTFSASELLALQATVFRYSQTVEILSRTADRLVGGLKQTLGTQV